MSTWGSAAQARESVGGGAPAGSGDPAAAVGDVVRAPLPGRVVPVQEVPDPVFAQGMVGPGVAVDPDREPLTVVAPLSGRLVKVQPHAVIVLAPSGHGVLVHLGIDTVHLRGEGFEVLVAQGDEVAEGDPLIRWDPAAVEAGGRSPVCPVVALDAREGAVGELAAPGPVGVGEPLFTWR